MSVQIARASWQLILIALVAIALLIGARQFPANLVTNAVLGVVIVASIALSIYALRQIEDDEDNAPRLKKNALLGFLAVAVLGGVIVWNNVRAWNAKYAAELAAKFATPTKTPTPDATPTALAASTDAPAATPKPTPITAEEVRTFARSYVALVKRGEFDEAYRYLPPDLQNRVSQKAHADHWSAAAPKEKLEELELTPASAEELPLEPGKSVEFRVQIPEAGAPRVLLVSNSSGKMAAVPIELAKK